MTLNNENTFYIVRRSFTEAGLFSYFFTSLSQIRYALEMGWLPIIDMQTKYYTFLHEADEVGRVNIWDRFFSQYQGYSLNEALNAKNVVVNEDEGWSSKYSISFASLLDSPEEIAIYKKIISNHVHLDPLILEYSKEVFTQVVPSNAKVLGVNYRESLFRLKPKGHCIQPHLDKVTQDINYALSQFGFTHIYLATEDHLIVEYFINLYGDKLLYVKRPRVNQCENVGTVNLEEESLMNSWYSNWGENNKNIETINFNRPSDKFTKAKEYISEMFILSRCDGLIGPVTNGLAYAYLTKKSEYEFQVIYNEVY